MNQIPNVMDFRISRRYLFIFLDEGLWNILCILTCGELPYILMYLQIMFAYVYLNYQR